MTMRYALEGLGQEIGNKQKIKIQKVRSLARRIRDSTHLPLPRGRRRRHPRRRRRRAGCRRGRAGRGRRAAGRRSSRRTSASRTSCAESWPWPRTAESGSLSNRRVKTMDSQAYAWHMVALTYQLSVQVQLLVAFGRSSYHMSKIIFFKFNLPLKTKLPSVTLPAGPPRS